MSINFQRFLARLLILIKKSGLLQLKLGVVGVGVNTYVWARLLENFFVYPSKFVIHVTNDQFSDKFNNGWKKIKMADLLCESIIWPCGLDIFSYILLKFGMHATNKQFSDKFDNGWIFF